MAIGDISLINRPSQDVASDTRLTARYIGDLDGGFSGLEVVSSLTGGGDQQDYFRFRATRTSFVRFGAAAFEQPTNGDQLPAAAKTVRFQIYNQTGRLVADSDPNAGTAYDQYKKLTSDQNLSLTKGNYVVRVMRDTQSKANTTYNYTLTLKSDSLRITDDTTRHAARIFRTTERPGAVDASTDSTSPVTGLFVNFIA
jgi:hypothetical protein